MLVNKSINKIILWRPCAFWFLFIFISIYLSIYLSNKFFQIQPILKERNLYPNNTRREETTLTRLCIGHTEPPSKCPCGNQYSIKPILIECTKLNHTKKKFYKANSMKELFLKIALKNIINFLKTIDLLLKI